MCLFTKESKPSQATENIKCYKVYLFDYNECCSPYAEMTIPNFGQYTNTQLGKAFISVGEEYPYTVYEGFHSFEFLSDAMNLAIILEEPIIAKCIIPEGSKYYKGRFNDFPSYCSESIIIKTIFKPVW